MNTPWFLAALVAGAVATALWVRSGDPKLTRLRGIPDANSTPARRRRRIRRAAPVLIAVPLVAYALGGSRAAALALTGIVLGIVVSNLVGGRRATRAAQRRKRDVSQACWTLAGGLRLGLVPTAALIDAATECAILAEPAAIARIGGDVVETLYRLGMAPGAGGLQAVARAWQVTARTGAPMEPTLSAVARSLREAVELDQLIAGELAAPRMTGRMLAVLPVFGLTLGYVIGGDPIDFLLDSLAGQACLVAGVSLAGGGVLWTERLANRVVSK